MSKPYFLIDFENVQPKALDRLKPGASRIKVFLGQHQNKLMLELVQALQPFGADAQYIQITGSGPDAVDFHIAYYIGRLAADEPGATFNIISKDRGFDPLVRHLTGLGITCHRLAELPGSAGAAAKKATSTAKKAAPAAKKATSAATAPAKAAAKAPAKKAAKHVSVTVLPESPGPASATTTNRQRVQEVVARLKKSSKPAKLATLKSSIKSWFKPAMDDKAVAAIVQSLQDGKLITVTGAKVTYTLG